ncbi:hypothetical protein RchiOBHm_Chr5g0045411 [Rosa chinensis]|uniref:Uncharacterized protein n=1 Tax=Rosa chinensis TaxID=74649 RepID=A0A2P6QDW0_ROSCH|nr:hypothetical protein RchiOBHm_Chr5g0045411 [Rosa chinensis]
MFFTLFESGLSSSLSSLFFLLSSFFFLHSFPSLLVPPSPLIFFSSLFLSYYSSLFFSPLSFFSFLFSSLPSP